MNGELLIAGYLAASGFLFALGGTIHKSYRRYGIPAMTLCYALYAGQPIFISAVSAVLLHIALRLGYGEDKTYLYRAGVAIAYVMPTFLFGFTLWQIITPVIFLVMFYLSNHQATEADFKWKIVEFATGVTIAITHTTVIL